MRNQYRFIGGKMNKDVDERLVPDGQYIEANNLRIISGEGGDTGVFKKFKGTTLLDQFQNGIDWAFSAVLGFKYYKGFIYVFGLNSTTGNTELWQYEIATTTSTLLFDRALGNETKDAPFNIDIVDDENVEGSERLLMYFNDRRNEPQKVNILKLRLSSTYYTNLSDQLVTKPSSLLPPTIAGGTSGTVNNIKDKNFQFAYRWVFEDGEYSPLTPFSGTDLQKIDYEYNHVLGVFYRDTSTGHVYVKYSTDGAVTLSGFDALLQATTAGTNIFATSAYGTPPYAAVVGTVAGKSTFYDTDDLEIELYSDAYPYSFNKIRDWIHIPRETNNVLVSGYYIDTNNYPCIWKLNRKNEKFDISYSDTSFSFASGYGWTGLASSEYGDVIYASYQKSNADPSKVICSTDGGSTYTTIHTTSGTESSSLGCSTGGDIAYLAEITKNGTGATDRMEINVYKCTNKTSFEKCSTTTIYLLGEQTDRKSSKIYTSSDGFIVYIIIASTDATGTVNYLLRSIDGGKTFQTVGGAGTEGLNRDGVTTNFDPIERLSVNTFGNVVQFVWNNSIWSSDDYGDTFTEIKSSLSSGTIAPIGMESAIPDEIKGRDTIVSTYNYIDVTVKTGNKHVTNIEIYAKDRENGDFFKIKEYDKERDVISDNTTQTFRFKNDGSYQILSRDQQNRYFDNIPITASSQAIVDKRLMYANYVDGRSLKYSDDSKVVANSTITINGTAYLQSNYKTLKTGTLQSYGILYKDAGGRPASILPIGDATIPNWYDDNTKQVYLASIAISHYAPEWAATYSIVRKKPLFDYDVVYRFEQAQARDGKIYLLLPSDVNAEVGYTLTYAGDGLEFSDVSDIFKIEEVVDNSAQSLRLNLDEGKWIVINDTSTSGFTISDITNGTDKYTKGCFYVQKTFDTEGEIVYYETPYVFNVVYDAVNDVYLHEGTVNQIFGGSATVTMSNDYDTIIKEFPYREEYKYSSLTKINTLGRGWFESDDIEEVRRYSSITWSDIYVFDNNYNGLSNFNPLSVKALPTKYGEINHISYYYSNLLALQDDIVSVVPVDKNILTTADGGDSVTQTSNVLGIFNPISSIYGCQSPESFSQWGDTVVFVDKKRGAILAINGKGMDVISDNSMSEYFRNTLKAETGLVYSCYNPEVKTFFFALPSTGKTVAYRPLVGWSYFLDYVLQPCDNDGYNLYSAKLNDLYSHDTNATLNFFYGNQEDADITFVANQNSSVIKVFDALMLEATNAWDTVITNSNQTTYLNIADFTNKEGFKYAAIPMADSSVEWDETLATQGVGTIGSYLGTTITFTGSFPIQSVQEGDTIRMIDGASTYELGVVSAIDHSVNTITVSSLITTPVAGKFVFSRKNNYLNGDKIRDYYAKLTLTHSGNGETELYAVNVEVKESKQ